MSFSKYDEYKESGYVWVGPVPKHWEVRRLKTLVEEPLKYGANESAELEDRTQPRFVRITDIDDDGGLREETFKSLPAAVAEPYILREGDVLLARSGATVGKSFIYSKEWGTACFAGYLIRARLRDSECMPKWLYYFCQTNGYWGYVVGSQIQATIQNVSAEKYANLYLPCPPREEQTAIANFLDAETSKIDALVAEQWRLIELLKEKRQAVISHAVTKGLNPNAPMKDSGIEWLGDVPEHWEVVQSRRLFQVRNEKAVDTDKQVTASQKYGILYQDEFVEKEGRKVVETIMGAHTLRRVKPNDFVISLRSFQGGIEWSNIEGAITFHYVVLTPIKHVHGPFFAYLFKSIAYIQALRSTTNLIRDGQDLRFSHFVQVDLPIVPKDEQKAIASFLDIETSKIDSLSAEAEKAIKLLQERRTALISAAVTGKIDVREYATQETA